MVRRGYDRDVRETYMSWVILILLCTYILYYMYVVVMYVSFEAFTVKINESHSADNHSILCHIYIIYFNNKKQRKPIWIEVMILLIIDQNWLQRYARLVTTLPFCPSLKRVFLDRRFRQYVSLRVKLGMKPIGDRQSILRPELRIPNVKFGLGMK